MNKSDRVHILKDLTYPEGSFSAVNCDHLLTDKYDNFVDVCNSVKVIPEDVCSIHMITGSDDSVEFAVKLTNGQTIPIK